MITNKKTFQKDLSDFVPKGHPIAQTPPRRCVGTPTHPYGTKVPGSTVSTTSPLMNATRYPNASGLEQTTLAVPAPPCASTSVADRVGGFSKFEILNSSSYSLSVVVGLILVARRAGNKQAIQAVRQRTNMLAPMDIKSVAEVLKRMPAIRWDKPM
jgi:hypothetical protein